MKSRLGSLIRTAAMITGILLSAFPSFAQFPKLDDLASQTLKEIKPLKPRRVAVADFRSPDGASFQQGHYFALSLSTLLQDLAKKDFFVASHAGFDDDLSRLHLTVEGLTPGDSIRDAASKIAVEVLVTGSLKKRGNSYLLQVTPVRVASAEWLPTLTTTVQSNEFFESIFMPLPSDVPVLTGKAVEPDLSIPSCLYCPDPSYSDQARRAKFNGSGVFQVLVSPDGRAQQVRATKLIGYDLDEQAFYAIKKWKFRPAKSKDGTPVAVIVPVEVTFKLF